MSEERKLHMGRRGLLAAVGAFAASPLLAAAPSQEARQARRASPSPVSGRRRLGSLEVSTIGLGVQNNYHGPPIAVTDALALIQRGMEQSAAEGHRMAFAVVEPSGELVAFARMDDVPYASIRLAQQKARTAARLRITTMEMEERVLSGRSVLLSSDEVIAIGGGVPIMADGRVIGALGVSGARPPKTRQSPPRRLQGRTKADAVTNDLERRAM